MPVLRYSLTRGCVTRSPLTAAATTANVPASKRAVWALNGLHVDGTLHLLLGGDGKSADFSSLKQYLNGDNVRLYCFGRDGSELAALDRWSPPCTDTGWRSRFPW